MPLKWRLERARRALLTFVMGLVHRKSRLVQVRQVLSYPESFDEGNETQLRGYVMLVSGKLPLLLNVEEHLIAAGAEAADEESEVDHRARRIFDDWQYTVQAITENVRGMENAIEHAWMERTLYEQEQMRAEQEALAEIERARTRSDPFSTTIDSPVFAITLVVATSALFVSIFPSWNHLFCLLAGIAVGSGILFGIRREETMRLDRKHKRGEANRHYYEFNLSYNSQLSIDAIKRLMSRPVRLEPPPEDEILPTEEGGSGQGKAPQDEKPDRLRLDRQGSVRVERVSDDEATYKIHLEATAGILPRPRFGRENPVEVFSIYEIFYHRPTQNAEFVLREVRVTAIAPKSLSLGELKELKDLIMGKLVNPLVPGLSDLIAEGAEPTTALFDVLEGAA